MIPIGAIIGERYQIVNYVDRGGMQDVYRARDMRLGLDVALKTPLPGQAGKRFKTSARISAMVNHHNVAKTLDCFEDLGAEYLIEEFIEGETLDKKLDRFGFLDPHLGARVLHHLAKGIAASHRVDVVHRDLKPSNVMVTKGVNVHELKITDFGIATLTQEYFDELDKDAGGITQSTSGTIKGALPFMAPEMMFRKPGEYPGQPADIWSLGAMMFKILTGEFPFGVFLNAAVNVKNKERLPWPAFMTRNSQFAPLAKELQTIIDGCLDYDPAARPTADQLVRKCDSLCYLAVDRYEGVVNNMIQNGYSGFIVGTNPKAFFSIESTYGTTGAEVGKVICFSSFPGSPHPRAHPIVVLKH
jgi:serine/threonine-protein kinase